MSLRAYATIAYLLAMVCFILAAARLPTRRVDLLPIGLALWVSVPLVDVLDE